MNSKIILCKNIKMDRDYNNVLSYTESQILELCQQNVVVSTENFSFIRANKTIQVPFSYGQCLQANYIAFQNPDYSNKWMFAWIDDVIYKGNSNTEISYTIDSWSTWYSKVNIKPCFIQREHTNNDKIGANTIPENLEIGEVIEEDYQEFLTYYTPENIEAEPYYFAIESTYNPITNKDFVGVNKLNGNLIGSWIFLFDVWGGSVGIPEINNFLADVNDSAKIESIKNMFVLPKSLVDAIGKDRFEKSATLGSYHFYILKDSDDVTKFVFPIKKITSFSDFVPKNKKVFVYPYTYILASNNIGNQIIYKQEDFNSEVEDETFTNTLEGELAVSIGVSGRLVPRGYKGVDYNYDETIPLAKFPTCSWASDAYINWLTENAVNIGSQIVSNVASGVAGNYGTTASGVAGLIGQFRQATLLPSIQGGNNTGDVNFSARKNIFSIHYMRAKTEYLKVIDDYFSRFRLSN